MDGRSPIAKMGESEILEDSIHFDSEDVEIQFEYTKFHKIEVTELKIQLILIPDEHIESPVLEIFFTNKEELKEFRKHFLTQRKDKGFLDKFNHWLHTTNKVKILASFAIALLFSLGVIYYLANHSYIFVPTEWDIKLGESTKSIMESEFTVCKDKKAENILSKSLQSLVPKDSKFKYEVKILSDSTPNAFAISGGKIYVLSGIFNQAKNSNELAGVLAHEIGHVERRHHIRNLTKAVSTAFLVSIIVGPGLGDLDMIETLTELGSTLLFLSYSRQFEEESDSYGVALLANNGYHPRGMSAFFRSMIDYEKSLTSGTILEESESEKQEEEDEESTSLTANNLLNFLSTHPPTEERIQAIQKLIRENNYKGNRKFISDQDWTYLQKSCSAL